MFPRRAPLVLLVVAALGLAGCGVEDSLAGTWTGGFKDSLGGFGGASLTFTQSGSVVGGSWQVFFLPSLGGSSKYNNSGSVTGTVEGNSISAVLSSQGPCPFVLQATRTGIHMTGSYAAMNCAVAQAGTLDLEKR
jgi:hypothetical protein